MTYTVRIVSYQVDDGPIMWTATLEGKRTLSVNQASPAAALAELAISMSSLSNADIEEQNPRVTSAMLEFSSGGVLRAS